jgi:Secretion system C-terminal sorting domain
MKLLSTPLSYDKLCRNYFSVFIVLMTFFAIYSPKIGYSQVLCYDWYNVGSAGFSAGNTIWNKLALDSSGTPYMSYTDLANNNKVSVMKYNGSAWVYVGTAGISAGEGKMTSIVIDGSGTPYVAYIDNINYGKVSVMKYNGSAWVQVGNAGFSAGDANYPTIKIDGSGTPYVAYLDIVNAGKVSVMKYDGNAWGQVGGVGFTPGNTSMLSMALDSSGTPYVAYQDGGNSNKASLMKYNGSAWVQVGNAGFSAGEAKFISIAIDNTNTPNVGYADGIWMNGGYYSRASVMKYNGSAWVQVGNASFTTGGIFYVTLDIDANGTLYLGYADGATNNYNASVMKYNGTTWVQVGAAGFSAASALHNSMVIDGNGTPYVGYADGADNGKATVQKFSATSSPSISITSTSTGPLCAGTSVTYTATLTNSGTAPTYQWIKNGINVGTNSNTYSFTPNNGDSVRCVMTSNAACSSQTIVSSNTIQMLVSPIGTTSIPTVNITSNPTGAVCAGTAVTYTATNTNGGTSPTYQWKKNGVNAGTNSSTYTYIPNNGDSVRCVMTSSLTCTVPMSSNTINMVVTPTVTPTVSINVSPNDTVCTGTAGTYTATITNGGATPTYQWIKNGVNVGTNSNTYTHTPNNGDSVRCVLTSNATCASPAIVSSNTIHMTVNPPVTPTITVASSPTGTICAGGTAAYTANITNGGPNPTFQWKKNGVNVGANSSIYNYIPNNGDSVRCVITSSAICASPAVVSSSIVNMVVTPIVSPTITIAASATGAICAGTTVTYTATISNGGTTPTYQWKVNGTNVGTNSNNYTYAPNNGDTISCVLTSNATCVVPALVTSSTIIMAVTPTVIPTIAITANPNDTVCTGTAVTYTASITNGGTTPGYQWIMNGNNVGTNSSTYTYTPNNGDSVRCVMTSNATCTSQGIVSSNYTHMTVQPIVTPTIAIAASPASAVCAGTTVAYTATISNGGTSPGYQWKKNGANAGTNNSVYTYTPNNGDSVRCVMTSNIACANPITANSNSISMVVNPNVVTTLTIVGNTNVQTGVPTTYNAVTNVIGATYQWQVDGVNVGTNSSTFIYTPTTVDAVISCYITLPTNICAFPSFATTKVTVHIVAAGVSTVSSKSAFNLYPNPANNILHVDNLTTNVDYQLQNLVGMTVLQGTFTQEQNTLLIKELPSGIYLLQLTYANGQREVVRVVKE